MLAGRYKIIKEVKEGGFSQTFQDQDLQYSQRQYCVSRKLQPPENDTFTVRTTRQLFMDEINLLKKLGYHAKISQLYTTFTEAQVLSKIIRTGS